MKCADAQTRLLALPDPLRLSADLRAHARTCPACTAFARTLARIDELLPHLPVPAPTAGAKAAFLDLAAAGPVIVRRPERPATPSGLTALGRAVWRARESWQYAGGVAAVLAVGIGLWWAGTRPGRADVAAGPRHELLARQVQSVARLAKATTAEERVDVWADVVGELAAEAGRVHKGAGPDDLAALDRMFARAVTDGLLAQARQLPVTLTVRERDDKLRAAGARLAAAEASATGLADAAPVQAVGPLRKLARMAKQGRIDLETIVRKGA